MSIKKSTLLLALPSLLLAPAAATASPLVSIGDHADIYFDGSAGLAWESNIFRDEDDEQDDIVYTVSPGLELHIGRGLTLADFTLSVREDFLRYEDEDRLDTELFHINAQGSYETGRLDLRVFGSFDEEQTTTGDNNVQSDLIELDRTRAGFDGEYQLSPKFSFGSGVTYTKTRYDTFREFFADRESFQVPADIFYELTPKVDLSGGYRLTYTDVDAVDDRTVNFPPPIGNVTIPGNDGFDTTRHFFNVGARGDLLPKLTGFFKVGITHLEDDRGNNSNSQTTGGFDMDLTYAATPKLTTKLSADRDFGFSGEGNTQTVTSVDLSASYAINPFFSASGNFGYTMREFETTDRDDDQFDLGVRLSYVPNRHWRISGGYSYIENDSSGGTSAGRSYENNRIDLRVGFRY